MMPVAEKETPKVVRSETVTETGEVKQQRKVKMPADAKAYAEMFLRPDESIASVRMEKNAEDQMVPVTPCPAVATSKGRQFVMEGGKFAITHGLHSSLGRGRLVYAPGNPACLAADDKRGIPADHVFEA